KERITLSRIKRKCPCFHRAAISLPVGRGSWVFPNGTMPIFSFLLHSPAVDCNACCCLTRLSIYDNGVDIRAMRQSHERCAALPSSRFLCLRACSLGSADKRTTKKAINRQRICSWLPLCTNKGNGQHEVTSLYTLTRLAVGFGRRESPYS